MKFPVAVYIKFNSEPPEELLKKYEIALDKSTLAGFCTTSEAVKDEELKPYIDKYSIEEEIA